jgi:hypothetical protein
MIFSVRATVPFASANLDLAPALSAISGIVASLQGLLP